MERFKKGDLVECIFPTDKGIVKLNKKYRVLNYTLSKNGDQKISLKKLPPYLWFVYCTNWQRRKL